MMSRSEVLLLFVLISVEICASLPPSGKRSAPLEMIEKRRPPSWKRSVPLEMLEKRRLPPHGKRSVPLEMIEKRRPLGNAVLLAIGAE